jgi:hypothetical protein
MQAIITDPENADAVAPWTTAAAAAQPPAAALSPIGAAIVPRSRRFGEIMAYTIKAPEAKSSAVAAVATTATVTRNELAVLEFGVRCIQVDRERRSPTLASITRTTTATAAATTAAATTP